MDSIVYVSRNKKAGFSIQKVFNTIINSPNNLNHILYEVPCFRANLKSILRNLKFVFSKRDKNKIYHITGDIHYCILALIGCKTVLTVHDLVLLEKETNKLKKTIYFTFWYYLPIKLATKVVCISHKTKAEILKRINKLDIEVITNPVGVNFRENKKEFNSNEPRILHIGTGWNKNLSNVIRAVKGVSCHLRVIGNVDNSDLLLLKENKINYSCGVNLSDNEILEEYKKADIISFPSFFEGFGMPIIEGQTIGRAVLTSNISPMKEIGNDSAQLVNPESVESIKLGFLELINNKEYRESLISKGLDNVKKYSLEKVVTQYKNIYNQISR
jgi:glycosyltransferase involved in cell wall biosynthesis